MFLVVPFGAKVVFYLLYIKGCCEALVVGIYLRRAQRLCKSLVKQRVHSNERMHPMSVLLMF